MYGPKPATHRTCTIGGMIGNNSCGSTAQAYGKTVDNIARLEVLTYDGLRMWVGPTSDEEYAGILAEGGRRAEIYRALRDLRDDNLSLIRTRYPSIPRRVSGYNLDSLLPENHFDLARAIVGSEGTLVTVLHAELTLVEVPGPRAMVVLGYPDVGSAGDAVPTILRHDPWQLEGLDQVLMQLEQEAQLAGKAIEEMPPGSGWLMIQFTGDTQDEADAKARGLLEELEGHEHEPSHRFMDDPAKEDELIEVREAGPRRHRPPGGQARQLAGVGGRRRAPGAARRLPARLPLAARGVRLRQGRDRAIRSLRPGLRPRADPVRAEHRRRPRATTAPSPNVPQTSSPPTAGRSPVSTETARPAPSCCLACSATRWSRCSDRSRPCSTPPTG